MRQHARQQRGAFHVTLLFKRLLRVTAKRVPSALVGMGGFGHAHQPQQPLHRRLLICGAGQQQVADRPSRVIACAQIAQGLVHGKLARVVDDLVVLVGRVVALGIVLVVVGILAPTVAELAPVLTDEGGFLGHRFNFLYRRCKARHVALQPQDVRSFMRGHAVFQFRPTEIRLLPPRPRRVAAARKETLRGDALLAATLRGRLGHAPPPVQRLRLLVQLVKHVANVISINRLEGRLDGPLIHRNRERRVLIQLRCLHQVAHQLGVAPLQGNTQDALRVNLGIGLRFLAEIILQHPLQRGMVSRIQLEEHQPQLARALRIAFLGVAVPRAALRADEVKLVGPAHLRQALQRLRAHLHGLFHGGVGGVITRDGLQQRLVVLSGQFRAHKLRLGLVVLVALRAGCPVGKVVAEVAIQKMITALLEHRSHVRAKLVVQRLAVQ